jgi:hypothetical protein
MGQREDDDVATGQALTEPGAAADMCWRGAAAADHCEDQQPQTCCQSAAAAAAAAKNQGEVIDISEKKPKIINTTWS